MEWEEISRRLRNGTSVSVLAELAGTTYKNMYNRIRRREQLDGKQYLKADQLKRPYKAQGGRKKAASVPEVKKKVPDPGPAASHSSNVILCEGCRHFRPETAKSRPYCKKYEHLCGLVYVCEGYAAGGPEVEPIGEEKAASVPEEPERVTLSVAIEKGYNCMNCDNLMRLPADRNLDGALFKMICAKAGTESPDENTCCCNYKPMPNDKKLPEILQKKLNIPEVEPIGEEKAPARPEVVEKVADVPEVVKEFACIPEGVVKDTLEKYRKEQADAVREMHAIETMYKLQKAKEMKLRTVVLALERLLEGGSL